jgi:uncharacterized protein YjbI with pentapeptide repeats
MDSRFRHVPQPHRNNFFMSLNSTTPAAGAHTVADATLAREDVQQLLGATQQPLRFEDCDFEGADLRLADLSGVRLVDAGLFRGATISDQQAAVLVTELGLRVL